MTGEPNATLVAREDVTPSIARLRVRPDAGVAPFEPGQYLALGIDVDGRSVQRPYSTASPRGEAVALEFLVRLVPAGVLTPRLWRLGAGSRVRVGRPKGLFVSRAGDPRRPLFIATGTGLAPLMSMLETRLRETSDAPRARPVVVHGVARVDELAWRDRLEALAARGRIRYVPAVSRPADAGNTGWPGAVGRLDALIASVLEAEGVDPAEAVAFVCGNPGMVDGVAAALRSLGVPAEAVRTEAYWVGHPPD